MDQNNQQNHNQHMYDPSQYQQNPIIPPFPQQINQFEQQQQTPVKNAEFQTHYPPQIGQQDQQFHQQFQGQSVQERPLEYPMQQQLPVNPINQGFYPQNMFQGQRNDQIKPSLETGSFQNPMIYDVSPQRPPHQPIHYPQHPQGIMMEQQQPIIQSPQLQQAQSFGQTDYQFAQQQRLSQQQHLTPQHQQQESQLIQHNLHKPDEERVVTTSPFSNRTQQNSTPKLPGVNQIQQNRPSPSQNNQQPINNFQRQQQPQMGQSSGMSQQLQSFLKHFLELIKKGEIDQVLQERSRSGIDMSTLVDEANYKQTPMFSTSLIPDDNLAVQMAKVLKEMGVNPAQPDTLNQTTMYYSAREGKLQLIDFLIENGCNVNHIDTYGQTPIFYACRDGRLETIKKLVSYGGDPDLVDNNGQTPIFYAIKQSKIDVVEFLLKQGANLTVMDKKGYTPMTWAKRQNKQHIIDLLVQHGAQPINDINSMKNKKQKQQPPPVAQKPKINERKIPKRYQLTVLRNGQYEPLSDEEFLRFKEENPDLAKYFDSQDPNVAEDLEVPEVPEAAQIYDCWDKAAKRLLNVLWKHNQAWIFHEAVDPKKLNIPDYYDIIKQPMDLGTVKVKLSTNQYTKMQDFLHDVQLVFDNCILYNGENSQVSVMCKAVRDEFHKQYQALFLDFYI